MGKGKNLKAALQSQQSRLKAKQKLSHAAQVTEQKAKKNSRGLSGSVKGKDKGIIPPPPRRITIPFCATDKILLIGEGNFSFARALIQNPPAQLELLPSTNITATAYDTETACYEKYPDAKEIVTNLRENGVEVLFEVDGTRLEKTPKLKGRRWDRVVWNFPHAGKSITDQDRNILSNQVLILGFLRSAAKMLTLGPVPSFTVPKKKKKSSEEDEDEDEETPTPDDTGNVEDKNEYEFFVPDNSVPSRGTILITIRNVTPYTLWLVQLISSHVFLLILFRNVPRLAKNPPPPTSGSTPLNPRFTLLRSFSFSRSSWSGYEHRMTKGERAHGAGKTGQGGEDRTWEFCLRDVELVESDLPKESWFTAQSSR
ncbi:hypothetical protein BDZ94DRAFT_1151295 [Collybia nuda]|uniref:25S rRNA (uridine-N(3))-methyltransferase BMT5-like domain-containing protein n=1 Tax=Collybia nuda TaxID=64659 RepID=A0A9P6CK66_9AGAR|nr:hypothetical protein BDZ94DRAFT_1151295 [Collybia nuda]